ncbi:hypothetical protein D9M72_521580 [compost metagenome]
MLGVLEVKRHPDPFADTRRHALGQPDADAALGKVNGLADHGAAVVEAQRRGQLHGDAVRLAHLPGLACHGDGCADDDQVVGGPEQVQDHRDRFVGHSVAARRELPDAQPEAQQVEHQQDQVGARDDPVEVRLLDDAALGRHVELARRRVDKGDQCRPHDVPREH